MSKYIVPLMLVAAVLAPLSEAQEASSPLISAAPETESVENQPIGLADAAAPATLDRPQWLETAKVVATLLIVIAVIFLAVYLLRRLAPRTVAMYSSDNLRLLARTYVGPRQMVCLMKAPGRLLVIGATQASISILSEITDPSEIERVLGAAEAASPKGASAAFRELLGSVTGAQKKSRSDDDLTAAVNAVSQRFADLSRRIDEPRVGKD